MKLHIYSHQSDAAPWSPWVAMCGRLISAYLADVEFADGPKPENVCAACWRAAGRRER